jgi:short-subunit dehydrogenase|nr:SDR family oxidoreductase [uncultured Undibacterium sp.]
MPTVLIIGASRGIGYEFARQYKAAGWRVITTARKSDDLAQLAAHDCEALPLDVNNINDYAGLAWRVADEKIDVAILNAGVFGRNTNGLQSPDQDEFDLVMHTNVLAVMRLLPLVLPMVENASGKLVVLSSCMSSISLRKNNAAWLYRASKAALNSVLKDVSLSTQKAICMAFNPGWVQTDMGGIDAEISVDVSVAGMRHVIAESRCEQNGQFLSYDGTQMTW